MFICKKCLNDEIPIYLLTSVGPCELCNNTEICLDIPSRLLPYRNLVKEPLKKGEVFDYQP